MTTWCNDFGEQVNAQLIIDSFTYCGVSDHFNMDECHQALQKLLNGDDLDEVFSSIPTQMIVTLTIFMIMVILLRSFLIPICSISQ